MTSYTAPGEPFVGRLRELDVWQARLLASMDGRGGLVLVVGEAGVGKTSIVQQFANAARTQRAVVLWGTCFEGEWQPPYAPWVDALGPLIASLTTEQLQQHLGVGASALAQLILPLRLRLPDIAPAASLGPSEERYRLYDAVAQFLLHVAGEQPLVVVLDDLHWADRDSLELFRYVARLAKESALLVVGVYRDPDVGSQHRDALNDVLAALQRETTAERVALRGFDLPEVATYLEQAAEQSLPQALVQTIHKETGGNPFYVRELFRHLVEEAKITRRAGRWTTDFSLNELGIPPGVRQVVMRRIARLAPETNALLRVAAAFTNGFVFHLLPALTDLSEETLLNSLDEALHAGLIRTLGGTPPRYNFTHAIVRHTLYDAMNPDRRARLHQRIAQVLELADHDHVGDHYAELAFQHHASAALPGAERGVSFCLAAAEQARAGYAHDQVVTFLHMARDLASRGSASLRVEVASKLAVAEAQALLLDDAQHSIRDAMALLEETAADPAAMAAFVTLASRALKEGGAASSSWQPLVERGLALMGDRRDLVWARLMLLCGRIEPVVREGLFISRWVGFDEEAVAIARTAGDEDDYAQTLEPLEWRTAEETDAISELATRWQRPTAVLRALDVVGRDLIYRRGDVLRAKAQVGELLRAGENYGSIPAQAEALVQLAFCHAILGELDSARQTLQQSAELVARLGTGHRLRALALLAMESVLGDYVTVDWPRLADTFARMASDPQTGKSALGLIAANFAVVNLVRAGKHAAASNLLALLTPALERIPSTTYLYNGGIDRGGTAVWELGAREFAASYRRLALQQLTNGVEGSPYRSNALTVARMAALCGDADEAAAYFGRARQVLEASGQRPLRAIADYDDAWALVRNGSSDRARINTLLDCALAQFRELDMPMWEQRTFALAAQVTPSSPSPPHVPAQPQTVGGPFSNLTTRELEVLRLIGAGATNKEIGVHLVVSVATVERHVANIYNKIGVRNRAEATAFALNHQLQ